MPHRLRSTLIAAGAVIASTAGAYGNPHRRPNIILFMVDDMGWQDTSVPFWNQRTRLNDTYETPNMERLAREGMLFTQAYASPISSPSRCSLMTGANAARHRVTNWTLRKNESTDLNDAELTTPDWNVNGIYSVGIICIMLGGGLIELKLFMENAISVEEEKAKAASKDKKKNKYAK